MIGHWPECTVQHQRGAAICSTPEILAQTYRRAGFPLGDAMLYLPY